MASRFSKKALRSFGIVLPLLCAGCGSYKGDLETMCEGPALIEKKSPGIMKGNELDPSQKTRVMVELIVNGLKTGEGKAFFASFAGAPIDPKEKAKKLSAEAAKVGISKCEMADWWAAP